MLGNWTGVVVFAVAIVLSIVLGEKLKINQGIFALSFALVIGGICGIAPTAVISKCFPTSVLYLLLITTFFYGFMNENGLIKALSNWLIWTFRKKPAWIPFIMFASAFLVSALGAGGEGSIMVLSPLFFALALDTGIDPILAVISCACGACSAGFLFWVGGGAFMIGIIEQFTDYTTAFATMEGSALTAIISGIILLVIFYLFTKGYKAKKTEMLEKPEPMTGKQKTSLWIVIVAIICVVGFPLLNIMFHSILLQKLAQFFNIRTVATFGTLACLLTRCADEKAVISRRIPWNLLIMLCGVMTLISLMGETGTVEFIISLVSGSIAPKLAIILLFIFCMVLGAVTSGLTVIALCAQLVPVLAAATALPTALLMTACLVGTNAMFISPYSVGGAMALSGCPDELRNLVIRKQYLAVAIHAVISFILVVTGASDLFTNLFL
ncbi:MAG: SLC13 family permease [Saccharofermentanales bacterium]|jgi:di/tricarboxylate transporter